MRRILSLLVGLALVSTVRAGQEVRVVLHVDDDAAVGGDGSGRRPFTNIPEAVEAARVADGPVRINVEPGIYRLTATVRIERALELQGSTILTFDGGGLPTGGAMPGTETRIVGVAPMTTGGLLAGGNQDTLTHGIHIGGFIFVGRPAPGGANPPSMAVTLNRVQDFSLTSNIVSGGSTFGFETNASSGRLVGNYISGVGAGAALGGGSADSPAVITVRGNRSIRNTIGGLLLDGASVEGPGTDEVLDAMVQGNDLSENDSPANVTSFGLRIFSARRDIPAAGFSYMAGSIRATISNNRIAANETGIVIDAGFPRRTLAPSGQCDPRTYTSTMDLLLKDNTVAGSLTAAALVTFTRQTATLTPGMLAQYQFLHGATFTISDKDGTLGGARVDHQERDPLLGPCPNDQTKEILGNTLFYNGRLLMPGTLTVPLM
jgi:hypothetical protein